MSNETIAEAAYLHLDETLRNLAGTLKVPFNLRVSMMVDKQEGYISYERTELKNAPK